MKQDRLKGYQRAAQEAIDADYQALWNNNVAVLLCNDQGINVSDNKAT